MSLRSTDAYVKALKAEGCKVTGHAGWTSVNRPGPWDPHGVIVHHTGPYRTVADMIDMLRKGRSDLPGPLCHAGGRPDGIIDLVGWFDTNHAGMGARNVLNAVLNDAKTPAPGLDAVDGNAEFYGLELIHPGKVAATIKKDSRGVTIAAPWPAVQMDSAVRYCAAICRLHDWKAQSCIYHKTWSTRKPDPVWQWSLLTFQGRVAERLRHAPSWSPGTTVTPPKPPIVITVPSPPPVVPTVDPATIDGAIVKVTELFDYLARLKAGA